MLASFPLERDVEWQVASRATLRLEQSSARLLLSPGEYALTLTIAGPTQLSFEMVVGGSSLVSNR
jgi:hypothetical protein